MWLMVCISHLLRLHKEKVIEVAECTLELELPVASLPQCNSGELTVVIQEQ